MVGRTEAEVVGLYLRLSSGPVERQVPGVGQFTAFVASASDIVHRRILGTIRVLLK